MATEDPGGLHALAERLERLASKPDAGSGDDIVREAVRALPLYRLRPLHDVATTLRRARDRLRRERRPEGFRLDGIVTSLIIMCEEHDAAIAPLRCARCGEYRPSHAVICRPLRELERRVCNACKEKRLDEGWSLLGTEPIDGWCRDCCSRMSAPSFCVGPMPNPTTMRACDRCADALRAEGWSASVVTTHSF